MGGGENVRSHTSTAQAIFLILAVYIKIDCRFSGFFLRLLQFGPYSCPSLLLGLGLGLGGCGAPPVYAPQGTDFSQNTPPPVVVGPLELLTYTTVLCQPSETQPAIHPPDWRLPEHIATETLLPHLFFPSLTVQLCRLGAIAAAWLCWGKGRQLTYGFLCIIALLSAQFWRLSWNSWDGKLHPSGPLSSPLRIHKCALDAKLPVCENSPV